MNFQEQMKEDIKVCFNKDEFAILITHTFGNQSETIPVLFDEEAEIVLKSRNSEYGFEGSEALVPMITVQKEDSMNITSNSYFNINGIEYEVIHKPLTVDEMKIYLGRV